VLNNFPFSFSNYNNAISLSIIEENHNIGFELDRLNLEEINDKKNYLRLKILIYFRIMETLNGISLFSDRT
jgi:hypothetical protein